MLCFRLPPCVCLLVVFSSSCAHPSRSAAPWDGGAPPRGADAAILARLQPPGAGGPSAADAIGTADLPADSRAQLRNLDDAYAQRRYTLLWTGLEEVVAERLLAAAAAQRGTDVASLLQQEVDAKVGSPSDDEVRGLFEANKALIPSGFSGAVAQLRRQWRLDRATSLRRALVDRLRAAAQFSLELAPPQLSRQAVALGDAPRRGASRPRVSIVAFGDYACPYSAQARRLLQRLEQLYPDSLQVAYRDFILPQHSAAQGAAEAAYCAQEQGGFFNFTDLLFAHADALDAASLQLYAKQAELDGGKFAACLASERPRLAVARSQADGNAALVKGTPALFINGMQIRGVLPLPLMQRLIDRELAAAP